jgi:hypothetical protein
MRRRLTLQDLLLLLVSILLVSLGPVPLGGCAGVKTVAKTANDIAHEACSVFASAREQQLGMSAADWCNLHANLEPFLDAVLSAERKAGISSGGERGPDETKDDAPRSTPASSIAGPNSAAPPSGETGPGTTKPGS